MEAHPFLEWVPHTIGHRWWYLACAAIALAACLTSFLFMIMNEKFSELLLSRVIICGGMLCFALVPLNPGWLPWGVMLTSAGYLFAAFLIATDWCHIENKWAHVRSILTGRKKERSNSSD